MEHILSKSTIEGMSKEEQKKKLSNYMYGDLNLLRIEINEVLKKFLLTYEEKVICEEKIINSVVDDYLIFLYGRL
jgi:hypothetical protein